MFGRLVCGVNHFHDLSAMDFSASENQKFAAVQLAADKASGDKPVANNVLVPITSMFSKLALDKVGAHHVITHLVSFENYKLPPGEWELHPSDDGSDTVVFGVQLGCEEGSVIDIDAVLKLKVLHEPLTGAFYMDNGKSRVSVSEEQLMHKRAECSIPSTLGSVLSMQCAVFRIPRAAGGIIFWSLLDV